MEIFDWINIVQICTEYFSVWQIASAAEYIVTLRRIMVISVSVAAGLYLLCLVLGGIGMHAMAKKVGMKHSFLAFLPFANTYYAGKLAGETQLFGKKMKRVGLYAMLTEIAYVAIGVFSLVITFLLRRPEYYVEQLGESGSIIGIALDVQRIPMALRWLVTANIVLDVVESISYIAMLFFFCVLFYAFFRKYYARGSFLMTFMCALLPLRGFVIFAVRNNTPVDYDAYMRRRMEEYRRAQGGYGPGYGQGGYGQGGYDAYGNRTQGTPPAEPFSDFGDAPAENAGDGDAPAPSGGGKGKGGDDPFPDF